MIARNLFVIILVFKLDFRQSKARFTYYVTLFISCCEWAGLLAILRRVEVIHQLELLFHVHAYLHLATLLHTSHHHSKSFYHVRKIRLL